MNILRFIIPVILLIAQAEAQQLLVRPYIQPGNASTLSKEEKVLIWQTDSIPANYMVTYSLQRKSNTFSAKTFAVDLKLKGKATRLYRAVLKNLVFDTLYYYEVRLKDQVLVSDSFRTRSKKNTTRFVVLGDFGAGSSQQAAIAYRIAQQKPQFIVTTGDNAYQNGLEEDYRQNVFPFYLQQPHETTKGVPLMNSIPLYMVLGNHDVRINNLDEEPGSFAYFYYNDLPLNAPVTQRAASITGSNDRVKAFRKNTRPRFPRMSNFSFDHGNVHLTCLDANDYINPLDPSLVQWLEADIGKSKADWKLVVFHHPGFNSSQAHYDYQLMRLLSPLFERLGVNLVLSGHVHNYQRSVPILFAPQKNEAGDQYLISPEGKVNGTFSLDTTFNGSTDTTPEGIIYIVTGAGGAGLYDMNLSQKPELWTHEPKENWAPFTTKLIADRHSFTLIETKGKVVVLQQIDLTGKVIDAITVTK